MSIGGDNRQESVIQWLCKELAKLIAKHPEAAEDLKNLGRKALDDLPVVPEWSRSYYRLFQQGKPE